jgi:hypothetical protein
MLSLTTGGYEYIEGRRALIGKLRRQLMLSSQEICSQLNEIYPDLGECGIDVEVEYDDQQNRWVVHLKKDQKQLKTFLEPDDVEFCMQGKQCVSLGIEINQLKDSIERMPTR